MKKFVLAIAALSVFAGATLVASQVNARPPVCNPAKMECL